MMNLHPRPFARRLASRTLAFARRLRADRSGNVMMILGFAMVPLIFGVGFGIDYNRAEKLQTRMNAAADAAALAAVNVKMMQQSDAAALAAARAMFNSQVSGLQGMVYDTSNANNPTITITSTGGVNLGRTATVTYSAASTNIFSGILGVPTLPVKGSATANSTRAPNINFYLTMDTSPSMLLPSTTAGLTALRGATTTSHLTSGCAFACHTQNPHSDNIYIQNSAGKDVWVDGTSGNWCAVASTSTNQVTCTTGTVYQKASGQYADAYWLTRNYTALYGGSNITLRIDEEQAAAQNLIPFAITTATNNQVTYQLQMFKYDWTHPTKTSPVTAVTSAMTDVNNLSSYTVPNFYSSQDNWYQNSMPTSTLSINDQGTETANMLTSMNALMPNPGDGSTAASPQEVLFIITDGVSDEAIGGNRVNREWNSTDLARCTTIKNRGIRIAILYTEYLPESLTGDAWSQANVAPYLPNVEGALQSCASARADGTPLYYKVSADQSISDALTALFALTVQTAHLTM